MKKQFRVCDLLSSSCFFQNVRRCVNSVLGVVAQYFVVAAASEHVLCPAQRLACLDASFCQVIQPIGTSGGDEPPLLFFLRLLNNFLSYRTYLGKMKNNWNHKKVLSFV